MRFADTSLLRLAPSELILGGQRSGKSRRAEHLASAWLAASPLHQAVLLATAQPWDDAEMHARIARHRLDRASRVPGLQTVEVPLALPEAIRQHSAPRTLVVVDCLTLWLTNHLMPYHPVQAVNNEQKQGFDQQTSAQAAMLLIAIANAPGPVVLVGNEIGLGVVPMGRETRAFVDALGRLNQDMAQACVRVVLMAAGLPLFLKGTA